MAKKVTFTDPQGNRPTTWNDLQSLRHAVKGAIDVKIDNLEGRMNERFGNIEQRQDEMNGRLDSLEEKLDMLIDAAQGKR